LAETPRRAKGRAGIADVAREAGVSKTAVSFAFNSPDRLSPETAQRIRSVADSLGYRPDPVARMLTQRRTNAIGVLTPQVLSATFSNPFFGAFTEGVALGAEAEGYQLDFISPIHGSLARGVGRATVDGVVAIGLANDHPEVQNILRAGIPIVLVDSVAHPGHTTLDIDDEGGARLAAEHVLALGHRAILIVAIEPPQSDGDEESDGVVARRLAGYRAELDRANVHLPDGSVVVGPASIEGGYAAFMRAWEDGLRPTAILAMSDAMAIGAMSAARAHRLAIPGDISVVGFDDIDLARYTDPPLTTVRQPIRQKGTEAVRLLLEAIEHGDAGGPEHRRLETRLVIRASTGPVPTSQEVVGQES
jgi:alanine racemase